MTRIFPCNIRAFLAASAVALAIPLTAAAHPGGEGHRGPMMDHGPGGHHADMGFPGWAGAMAPHRLRALNLTEAQKDKIFEIMHAQVPLVREQMKGLRKAQSDLHALIGSPEYSEASAKSLADAIAQATADMALTHAKTERQIFELLTPDQRKQLAEPRPAPEQRSGMGATGRNPQVR